MRELLRELVTLLEQSSVLRGNTARHCSIKIKKKKKENLFIFQGFKSGAESNIFMFRTISSQNWPRSMGSEGRYIIINAAQPLLDHHVNSFPLADVLQRNISVSFMSLYRGMKPLLLRIYYFRRYPADQYFTAYKHPNLPHLTFISC